MNSITTITRQIALDIETTGMNQIGVHYEGHRIIEIGATEIINRKLTNNDFHTYLKPNRLIDPEAFSIHGIKNEFLIDKPTFSEKVDEFLKYIKGAELIIHNALFDIGFIDYEFSKLNFNIPKINILCRIIDSLVLARKIFPGKRNNLDALCSRYKIDNSKRTLHGALIDAKILANVYLAMTGGQTSLFSNIENENQQQNNINFKHNLHYINNNISNNLHVILANDKELIDHELHLDLIQRKNGNCLWRKFKNR